MRERRVRGKGAAYIPGRAAKCLGMATKCRSPLSISRDCSARFRCCEANKALRLLSGGEDLRILATDRAAAKDFDNFCSTTGHHLIASEESDWSLDDHHPEKGCEGGRHFLFAERWVRSSRKRWR